MANNRMWIRCRCGAKHLIAKDFGHEWKAWLAADDRDLQQFMDAHQHCGDLSTTVIPIASSTHFGLEYDHVPIALPALLRGDPTPIVTSSG